MIGTYCSVLLLGSLLAFPATQTNLKSEARLPTIAILRGNVIEVTQPGVPNKLKKLTIPKGSEWFGWAPGKIVLKQEKSMSLLDIATGKLKSLPSKPGNCPPTYSPRLKAILLPLWNNPIPADLDQGLWAVPLNGSAPYLVMSKVDADFDMHCKTLISPNGMTIASGSGGPTGNILYVGPNDRWKPGIRITTIELTNSNGMDWLDNTSLLIGRPHEVYDQKEEPGGIWILNTFTKKQHRWLYTKEEPVSDVICSPDRKWVAVGLNMEWDVRLTEEFTRRLDLVSTKTKVKTTLRNAPAIQVVGFSRDSRYLLFMESKKRLEKMKWNLFVLDVKTRAIRQVSSNVDAAVWID